MKYFAFISLLSAIALLSFPFKVNAQILYCTELPREATLLSTLPKEVANKIRRSGVTIHKCSDSTTGGEADFIYIAEISGGSDVSSGVEGRIEIEQEQSTAIWMP